MDDIDKLLNHFTKEKLSDEEINDLRDSAQKFLLSKKLLDYEKIDVLNTLKEILEESKQSYIAINDEIARGRIINNINLKSFNLQQGVYNKSNLICGINLSQSPIYHYEIHALMEKVLNNFNRIKSEVVSTDTIYLTLLMQFI